MLPGQVEVAQVLGVLQMAVLVGLEVWQARVEKPLDLKLLQLSHCELLGLEAGPDQEGNPQVVEVIRP